VDPPGLDFLRAIPTVQNARMDAARSQSWKFESVHAQAEMVHTKLKLSTDTDSNLEQEKRNDEPRPAAQTE